MERENPFPISMLINSNVCKINNFPILIIAYHCTLSIIINSRTGAIAGIANQPLQVMMSTQEVTSANNVNKPPSAITTASGVVLGVGRGLVGMVTKPIGQLFHYTLQHGINLLLKHY